jgi:hypothetical protein
LNKGITTLSESTTIPAVADVPAAKPRKRKRIFMWFFLAVQAIFIAWLVTGIVSAAHGIPADAHAYCKGNGWSPLFKSYQDCIVHYANGMRGAAEVGSTIGAGLVIGLWVASDVILGIGRLIVVLARLKG